MTKENNNWLIHQNPKTTHKTANRLKKALEEENESLIIDIIRNNKNVRSLIIRLGEKGGYLKLIKEAFLFLLPEKERGVSRIEKTIKEHNLNYFFLAEMMAVSFHLNEKKIFDEIYSFFDNKKNKIKNTQGYLFALNVYASWEGAINKNHENNLKLNKKVIELARENGFRVMQQKAKFALSDHKYYKSAKPLKPQLRIKDFEQIAQILRKHNVEYDALRADIEKLDSKKIIIGKTTNNSEKQKKLNNTLEEGKLILAKVKSIDYPKALIRIKTILAELYEMSDNKKAAKRFEKEIDKLRKTYF